MSFKYSSKKDRDALVNIFKVVGDKSFTYSQIKHLLDSSQRLRVLYLKGYVKKIGRVSPYKPVLRLMDSILYNHIYLCRIETIPDINIVAIISEK